MAPFAASLARVHPFLTPCSGAHCFPQTDQIVQSQTGTRSPIARAIAAPERQVVQLPNVQPSRDYKQSDQVPGRLMRICTLTEDPAGAEATSSGRKDLPVGTWEEGLAADTWKRHLLYPRSFYEQFIVHITRSSDAIYGEGKGPFSLDMKVRRPSGNCCWTGNT